MISLKLHSIAASLNCRTEAPTLEECRILGAVLVSLADRAAQMEAQPIPEVKWSELQRGLVVIDGGKAPLAFRMGGGL